MLQFLLGLYEKLTSNFLFDKNVIPIIYAFLEGEDYKIGHNLMNTMITRAKIYDQKIFLQITYLCRHFFVVHSEKSRKFLYSFEIETDGVFDIYNSLIYLRTKNIINVYSLKGQKTTSFGKNFLTNPGEIRVRNNKIFVLHNDSQEIIVFDLSYNFLNKFSIKKCTHFDVGSSIFTLSRGNIVSYDFEGNILKTYENIRTGNSTTFCLVDDLYLAICFYDIILIFDIQTEKIKNTIMNRRWKGNTFSSVFFSRSETHEKLMVSGYFSRYAFVFVRKKISEF